MCDYLIKCSSLGKVETYSGALGTYKFDPTPLVRTLAHFVGLLKKMRENNIFLVD
jgi:hypothetical protein